MNAVDWTAFSWEAFATIVTGLAAVGAALVVGVRQTRISGSQNKLLDQQSKFAREAADRDYLLQAQSFRLQLLEERRSVLEEFRRLWGVWFQDGTLREDDWNALRRVLHSAQLVYSRELSDKIAGALDGTLTERHMQERANQAHKRGDGKRAQSYLDKSSEAGDAVFEVMPNLLTDMVEETRVLDWEASSGKAS